MVFIFVGFEKVFWLFSSRNNNVNTLIAFRKVKKPIYDAKQN